MKKVFLPFLSIALAIAASAYTSKSNLNTNLDQKSFVYDLYGQTGQDDPTNLSDPNNYSLTGNNGADPLICSGTTHRCGVIADDNGSGEPVMSTATPVTRD